MLKLWQQRVSVALASAVGIGVIAATAAGAQTGRPPAHLAVASASITTVTGAQVTVAGSRIVVTRAGASRGFLHLTLGGQAYLVPSTAVPYLGRGLDLSLFRLNALAAAERSGRVQLTITYSGRVPALPGVRITAAGAGRARGYLTTASATQFGAMLARRALAPNVGVSMVGASSAHRHAATPTHTLTVTGTNLAGKPDTGDQVYVTDVVNANDLFGGLTTFKNGVAKLTIPSGKFWAVGAFTDPDGALRLDVLPQFSVSGDTKIGLDDRKATSKLSITTPRAATSSAGSLQVYRGAVTGPAASIGWLNFANRPLYINTTSTKVTEGKLGVFVNATMLPPTGSTYVYGLGFRDLSGLIHPVHYVVKPASLATVQAKLFASTPGTGYVSSGANFVGFWSLQTVWDAIRPRTPATATLYLTASPAMAWSTVYQQGNLEYSDQAATQIGASTLYRPGSTVTEDWNAYPLHPAPNMDLIGAIQGNPITVSASRSGNTLSLNYWPFSDSVPGHIGTGYATISPSVSGTYLITADGKKIAGGSALVLPGATDWSFSRQATLPAKSSVIGFTLTAVRSDKIYTLSTRSSTTWTWRSGFAAHHVIPSYWRCSEAGGNDCVAQPLLTLGYSVAGLGLTGRTAPGTQTLGLRVGHLQLAAAPAVSKVSAQVSFDDGKTWHPATVTGTGGVYKAVYSAPAGSLVTLRVSASDAAGAAISETITRAYGTTG